MDSQENTLKEGTISDEQLAKETPVEVENAAKAPAEPNNYKS